MKKNEKKRSGRRLYDELRALKHVNGAAFIDLYPSNSKKNKKSSKDDYYSRYED